jgi:streptogramin lyase
VDSAVFADRTPTEVAVGEGAVWVTTGDTVTRLDPDSLDVEATISVNRGPRYPSRVLTGIAAAEGAVWVAVGVEPPQSGNAVARIDPRTSRVVANVELLGHATDLAVGKGAVWVTEEKPGFLVRIDPTTNTEAARIDVAEPAGGVATGAGSVWIRYIDLPGGVAMIDPRINQELRAITLESQLTDIAVSEGVVWAAAYVEGAVFRIVT